MKKTPKKNQKKKRKLNRGSDEDSPSVSSLYSSLGINDGKTGGSSPLTGLSDFSSPSSNNEYIDEMVPQGIFRYNKFPKLSIYDVNARYSTQMEFGISGMHPIFESKLHKYIRKIISLTRTQILELPDSVNYQCPNLVSTSKLKIFSSTIELLNHGFNTEQLDSNGIEVASYLEKEIKKLETDCIAFEMDKNGKEANQRRIFLAKSLLLLIRAYGEKRKLILTQKNSTGLTRFHEICFNGNFKEFGKILGLLGVDTVNYPIRSVFTPNHRPDFNTLKEIAEFDIQDLDIQFLSLLSNDGSFDYRNFLSTDHAGFTVLHEACHSLQRDIVYHLVRLDILIYLCSIYEENIIELLIQKHSPKHQKGLKRSWYDSPSQILADPTGHFHSRKSLISAKSKYTNETALHVAIKSRNIFPNNFYWVDISKILILGGVDCSVLDSVHSLTAFDFLSDDGNEGAIKNDLCQLRDQVIESKQNCAKINGIDRVNRRDRKTNKLDERSRNAKGNNQHKNSFDREKNLSKFNLKSSSKSAQNSAKDFVYSSSTFKKLSREERKIQSYVKLFEALERRKSSEKFK